MSLKSYEKKISKKCHVIKERKSELRVLNSTCKEFLEVKVDGGLYNTTKHKKCDYILLTEKDVISNKCTSHFIELKWTKIKDAFEQIMETIDRVWWKYNIDGVNFVLTEIKIIIVSSKTPLNYQTEIKHIKKKYSFISTSNIFVKRTPFEYSV